MTIRAILKIIAWSNSLRSSPVSFLIFSSLYTRVFLCTKSFLEVSETFRLFSKKRCIVKRVSWSSASILLFLKTSLRNVSQRVVGRWSCDTEVVVTYNSLVGVENLTYFEGNLSVLE